MGFVIYTSSWVEPDLSRAQPGTKIIGEIARGAIVANDNDRRCPHILVGQCGDQKRLYSLGDEDARPSMM
jgi:hypothetical protein